MVKHGSSSIKRRRGVLQRALRTLQEDQHQVKTLWNIVNHQMKTGTENHVAFWKTALKERKSPNPGPRISQMWYEAMGFFGSAEPVQTWQSVQPPYPGQCCHIVRLAQWMDGVGSKNTMAFFWGLGAGVFHVSTQEWADFWNMNTRMYDSMYDGSWDWPPKPGWNHMKSTILSGLGCQNGIVSGDAVRYDGIEPTIYQRQWE